jgi:hypothetical protein
MKIRSTLLLWGFMHAAVALMAAAKEGVLADVDRLVAKRNT